MIEICLFIMQVIMAVNFYAACTWLLLKNWANEKRINR
jgi:hypothetical protein